MMEQYRVRERVSADERMAENISAVVEMFRELDLDYAIFGSCGIQTYFNYFFYLPNDLDVIIRKADIHKLRSYCMENGYSFVEEVGRSKICVNGLFVQVIPGYFSVVDKSTNTIIAEIDLSTFISSSVTNHVKLLCASTIPKINVVSVEGWLFIDLIRTINTNSLMRFYFVFRYLAIDNREFGMIMRNNIRFTATILQRLDEYTLKLKEMSHFSKDEILPVQNKIADLRKHIAALSG